MQVVESKETKILEEQCFRETRKEVETTSSVNRKTCHLFKGKAHKTQTRTTTWVILVQDPANTHKAC